MSTLPTSLTSDDRPAVDGRWQFFGEASLPADPQAREREKRGRRWLVVSYVFCPCHIPLALALLGAVFGGTTFGAALAGNAIGVGAALTAVYAVVLWRGFRLIRQAKRIEAAGGACASGACGVPVRATDAQDTAYDDVS